MDDIVIELFLLSIGASFVQRTTGFGFGIFIMTMLPSIMPSYGEATTLSGILAMTTSLIIVIQKYKYITWRRLLPFCSPSSSSPSEPSSCSSGWNIIF